MFNYSVDDFEIVRFFSYTSTIQYGSVIAEVDMNNYRYYPNICEKFDNFYKQLEEKATKIANEAAGEERYHIYFSDNKTVFQIRHKFSGKVFFIGRYDWRRAIGTGCYLFDGRIYDFKTHQISDYVSDIRADERFLWKKVESLSELNK